MGNTSTKTEQSSSQTNPWAPQAGALTTAFQQATDAYGKSAGAQAPTDFVAGFTPDQLKTFQSMIGYGSNNGAIPQSSADAGGILSGAGAAGAAGGLAGLANYKPTDMASILSDANAAANDPSIDGRIQAAMRDANRAATETALPQIARNASLTGNTNSSRTGVAEGIVQRGLADATADTSANIRGDAYNQGLATSLARAQGADSNSLGALSSLVNGGTSAASAGVNANSGAIQQQGGLYDIANAGGAGQQAANQAVLDNQQQKYQSQVSSPFDALQQFMQIIGSQNWGGSTTGTSTSSSTPSTMDTIGKLMSAGGSLFGKK